MEPIVARLWRKKADSGVIDDRENISGKTSDGVHVKSQTDLTENYTIGDQNAIFSDSDKLINKSDSLMGSPQKIPPSVGGTNSCSEYSYGGSDRNYNNTIAEDLDRSSIASKTYIPVARFRELGGDSEANRLHAYKRSLSNLQPKNYSFGFKFQPRFKSNSLDKWGRSFSMSKFEPLFRSRVNVAYTPLPCFINPSMHSILYDLEKKHIYNSRSEEPMDFSSLEYYLRVQCFHGGGKDNGCPNSNIYGVEDLLPMNTPVEKDSIVRLRYTGYSINKYKGDANSCDEKKKSQTHHPLSDDASPNTAAVFRHNLNHQTRTPKPVSISKFIMLWSTPLHRLYIFMFLIERGYENLYLFLHSVMRLKLVFLTDPIMLKSFIPRLFSRYLKPESELYIGTCFPDCGGFLEILIRLVKSSIRSHRVNLFDDICSFVFHYIFIICTYGSERNAVNSSETITDTPLSTVFEDSPEYQMLVSDYGLGQIPTSGDVRRTTHGVCTLRRSHYSRSEFVSQMLYILHDVGIMVSPAIFCSTYNANNITAVVTRSPQRSRSTLRPLSLQSGLSSSNSIEADKNSSLAHIKQNSNIEIDGRKNLLLTQEYSRKAHQYLHNFRTLSGTLSSVLLYCNHCLCRRSYPVYSDADSLNICTVCGYICHKCCRYLIVIPCFAGCKSFAVDTFCPDELFLAGRNPCYKERMEAVLKEIEIEKRIFEGFKSFIKARNDLLERGTKLKKKDVTTKSLFNLHLSMHESKMLKLQEKAQRCRLTIATTNSSKDITFPKENGNGEPVESVPTPLDSNVREQLVIKSRYRDKKSGADILKTVVLNPDTKTKDVLAQLVSKLHLIEPESRYMLLLTDKNNFSVPLLPDELIEEKINKDFDDCEILIQKKNIGDTSEASCESRSDFELIQTLKELVNSENEYYSYLVYMHDLFMVPLELNNDTKDISVDIFSNLRELIALHEKIVTRLKGLVLESSDELTAIIQTYEESIDDFVIYQVYCRGQPLALKLVSRLRCSKVGSKILSRSESSIKLDKQTLNDLLVKPMQRITRYPLFFRRIISSTPDSQATYGKIAGLITKFENTINYTNNLVKREQMANLLAQLDRDINLNGIFPHFSLLCASRELISVNSFYITQNMHSVGVRAEFYLMSDMILVGKKKRSGSVTLVTAPIMLESATISTRSTLATNSGHYARVMDHNKDPLYIRSQSYSEIRTWMNLVLTVQLIFRYDMWLYVYLRSTEIYKYMIDNNVN